MIGKQLKTRLKCRKRKTFLSVVLMLILTSSTPGANIPVIASALQDSPSTCMTMEDLSLPLYQIVGINGASFSEASYNETDALVLSTLIYLNFEYTKAADLTTPQQTISVHDAISSATPADLIKMSWLYDFHGTEFVENLLDNCRYGDIKIGNYVNEVSMTDDSQFAAATFYLPNNCIYVAFRGTDNSIPAWKENAACSYMKSTLAQTKACEYLETAAELNPGSTILVGGHSKGGNLAEYASAACGQEVFNRIKSVRSYDGPGFLDVPSKRCDTNEYQAKLVKYTPQDSIIGRLFVDDNAKTLIVESNGSLFSQHATTNWHVSASGPVLAESYSTVSEVLAEGVNAWIYSFDDEERQQLVDAFFSVLYGAGFQDWVDFKRDPFHMTKELYNRIIELDSEAKDQVVEALTRLWSKVWRATVAAVGSAGE